MKPARLDTDFMVARRLELGYSHRKMEEETGLSVTTIASLETGRNHTKVTLAMLDRFAAALQVSMGRLLAERHRTQDAAAPAGAGLSEDACRLGQLLLAAGKGIPRAAAARTLDVGLKRIHSAVRELQAYSASSPLVRLTTANSRVALVLREDALTASELNALRHAIMAVDDLRLPAARMLSAVAHREVTSDHDQRMREHERPHLFSLLNQRLIERTPDGGVQLSGEVAFSLGLCDARAAGLRRDSN